jgi:hypothetical protein
VEKKKIRRTLMNSPMPAPAVMITASADFTRSAAIFNDFFSSASIVVAAQAVKLQGSQIELTSGLHVTVLFKKKKKSF